MSKRSTSGGLLSLAVGLIGIATMEHWIPSFVAVYQYCLTLAFAAAEAIL